MLTTHPLYGKYLIYHGRLPKEQAMAIVSKATYTLMPSRFLETFGLVALDSLALGVPVVAEKKGGLIPFVIDDSLRIDSAHSLVVRMKELIHTPSLSLRQKALEVASFYTPSRRVDIF
jgi:UDP-glucose:tetrahydrobiopterin glucosyltransferase